jgi:hypothetical protein
VKLNYRDIKNNLFSPGNIYWERFERKRSCISKKGDAINHHLIKKLDEAGHMLVIEDSESKLQKEVSELLVQYNQSFFMKDKINYRDQMISLLRFEFIEKKKSQFELNLLAWSCFSNFTEEEIEALSYKDNILLTRHLNVASSYVLCAFFLGYYEINFLKNLFTSTMKDLFALGDNLLSFTLKEKLEFIRIQETFDSENEELVSQVAGGSSTPRTMFLERYDGSGVSKTSVREMSDLEIVLVALNQFYGFKSIDDLNYANILRDIEIGELKCEPRVLKMLQRVLYKKPKNILASMVG